jgi:hypothetical protein
LKTPPPKRTTIGILLLFLLAAAFIAGLPPWYFETIAGPLLTDFGFALIAGLFLPNPGFRILAGIFIPVIAAVFFAGPDLFLGSPGEQRGWAVIVFMALSGWGLLASAAGTLAGYGIRRATR